ncbi:hypothetical protein Lepto7376_1933 [[Leptolyngbya] sp. PCC 7376]|uniref:hypothetical protein n=1 Tax=[Leptolyngbya] sp. PCC 7376 TaxID=111781 RepID=UPI00029F16B1|nr:hypothetical protein [[Leptolyngbya] sp. PCC 7376]AFY38247.1 hypothetical protein Lepto7376_1933 [[Leptolyngbya] sp. PCC 7376]
MKSLIAKMGVGSAVIGLALVFAPLANAREFSFSLSGFDGDGEITGSFSGEDGKNGFELDGMIELGELTEFELNWGGNSKGAPLEDLVGKVPAFSQNLSDLLNCELSEFSASLSDQTAEHVEFGSSENERLKIFCMYTSGAGGYLIWIDGKRGENAGEVWWAWGSASNFEEGSKNFREWREDKEQEMNEWFENLTPLTIN